MYCDLIVISFTFINICVCQSLLVYFFFFSSRRRHTRCSRDWSSDVCSSDLASAENSGAIITSLKISLMTLASDSSISRLQMMMPPKGACLSVANAFSHARSEEHTSELQSRLHLVCRLLLEKKKHSSRSYRRR